MAGECEHLQETEKRVQPVRPSTQGCEECLQSHGVWVHLRLCMSCGHVGCCDNSPNKHATKHAHRTHHPVIRSYEPGEDWAYCYPHDQFIEELAARSGESAPRHFSPK